VPESNFLIRVAPSKPAKLVPFQAGANSPAPAALRLGKHPVRGSTACHSCEAANPQPGVDPRVRGGDVASFSLPFSLTRRLPIMWLEEAGWMFSGAWPAGA
jgi:hypothetical protein